MISLFLILFGLVFMVAGWCIISYQKKKEEGCSDIIKGKVIGYDYSNKAPRCIVEYVVDDKIYQAKRKFRGIIEVSSLLSVRDFKGQNNLIYIDENDYIHIRKGAIIDYEQFAQGHWPINSLIDVYYNPEHPEIAIVERKDHKSSLIGIIFFWIGMTFFVIGDCLFMMK